MAADDLVTEAQLSALSGAIATGIRPTSQPIPLAAPWQNFSTGAGYAHARYVILGHMIALAGLIRYGAAGDTIAIMPAGARPINTHLMTAYSSGNLVRIDASPSGALTLHSSANYSSWLSLEGVCYLLT